MSNKNSNGYILFYTCVLTLVCGITLYIVSSVLKPAQDANIELARKKSILATILTMDETWDAKKIESTYNTRVKGYVIGYDGKVIEGKKVTEVSVEAENKKPAKARLYPVYEIASEKDPNQTEYYVFATSGKGLWDKISSYLSLKADLNTINGVVFDHKAETPGLGARIKDDEFVYNRYAGKSIYEGDKLTPVIMMKGEGNDYSTNPHAVDGMSGATKTAVGVNEMFIDYLSAYENFIKSKKTK